MKEFKILDFMLDLETFGNKERPVICQVAAVAFDLKTGETFQEFDQLISPQSAVKAGMKCEGDTVDWWLKQDQAVIEKVFIKAMREGKDVVEVLKAFATYIQETKEAHKATQIRVWSNGFDNAWLFENYYACNLPTPYMFFVCQDVRSLVDIGRRDLFFDPKKSNAFTGEAHNAIDDCKHQIKYVHDISKKIRELQAFHHFNKDKLSTPQK